MRYALIAAVLAASFLPIANASEYELKPGTWQLYEGIGIDHRTAGQSSKTICIKPNETSADVEWFIALAKPRADCSTHVISHNQNEIHLDFSCPMNGNTLKGPSVIRMTADRITIESDLALDLPYAPLPMGQKRTAFFVSGQCH